MLVPNLLAVVVQHDTVSYLARPLPGALPNILAGLLFLLFGRRLFWLFVGGVGFIVAGTLAASWLPAEWNWLVLVIAATVGLIGAVVSMFLQKFAVAVAGFFAGGQLLFTLAVAENFALPSWAAFLIGGLAGAILALVMLPWALVFLTSLCGASLVTESLRLEEKQAALIFLVLLVTGMVVQTRQLLGRPPKAAARESKP